MSRVALLIATLVVLVTPRAGRAVFHVSTISEVMSGVNGDPSVQYVEVRMGAAAQDGIDGTYLSAFNCTGTSHSVLMIVPHNILNSGVDVHFLMATTSFAAAAGITPDFTWDPSLTGNIDPTCGMVCWGGTGSLAVTMPDDADPNSYVDCVGYGGYSGPTKTSIHDGTPLSGLPTGTGPGDGMHSLTRLTFTGSNLADFQFAEPSPTNNNGDVGVFGAATTTTTSSTTSTSSPSDTTVTDTTATTTSSTVTTATAPRVTTSTATTTTQPAETACAPAVSCDDGDGCSLDRCVVGTGCVHDAVTTATQLTSLAPACAGQPVPASVGQQLGRGCGLVEAARTQPGKKAKSSLTKAVRALKRAAKVADKAASRKKSPLSADCAAGLSSVVGGARDQALRQKSGL